MAIACLLVIAVLWREKLFVMGMHDFLDIVGATVTNFDRFSV